MSDRTAASWKWRKQRHGGKPENIFLGCDCGDLVYWRDFWWSEVKERKVCEKCHGTGEVPA